MLEPRAKFIRLHGLLTRLVWGVVLTLAVNGRCQNPSDSEKIRQRTRTLCEFLLANGVQPAPQLEVSAPQEIAQTPGQPWPTGLGPIWHVSVRIGALGRGHFMFESAPSGELHEFAIDVPVPIPPEDGAELQDAPNLQQFLMKGAQNPKTASGCVPTSASCLIGYWIGHGFPQWSDRPADTVSVDAPESLKQATLRLRGKMRMLEIADTCGYTDDGTALSGAFPDDLVQAIRSDAEEHHVRVRVELAKFELNKLREEIRASRPALVSCVVRLPHKPHLSWGHEVLAVGWQKLEGIGYVGVRDNFFPTQNDRTIRWIREGMFHSMITVAPTD